MEVQEPTDYTMRVEKVTPGGLTISDELIHQGLGVEKMLKCFHYKGCSFEEAMRKWKITPEVISSSDEYSLRSIFNKTHTDCFALKELDLKGEIALNGSGDYFIAVIYSGEGIITCGEAAIPYSQGDEFFFPAAIKNIRLNSSVPSKIMLCYPPG